MSILNTEIESAAVWPTFSLTIHFLEQSRAEQRRVNLCTDPTLHTDSPSVDDAGELVDSGAGSAAVWWSQAPAQVSVVGLTQSLRH